MKLLIEIIVACVVAVALLTAPKWASGDETGNLIEPEECNRLTLVAGGWSNHWIDETEDVDKWNETHKAFGFRCDSWGLTRFKNSYGRTSVAVSKTFYLQEGSTHRLGIYTGIWTGYEDLVGGDGIVPAAALKFEKQIDDHLWAGFLLTPPIQSVQIEWVFW